MLFKLPPPLRFQHIFSICSLFFFSLCKVTLYSSWKLWHWVFNILLQLSPSLNNPSKTSSPSFIFYKKSSTFFLPKSQNKTRETSIVMSYYNWLQPRRNIALHHCWEKERDYWRWTWKGPMEGAMTHDIGEKVVFNLSLQKTSHCTCLYLYNDITITHQKCHKIIWLSVFKYLSNYCIMCLYVQIGSEHNYYVKITCHISIYIIVINCCNLYISLHNFI